MKKFFVLLCVPFVGIAHATTVNIDWDVDGSTYAQTTCEIGGNLTLPAQTPTKYGYTFKGWKYDVVYGTVSQSGTPTPTTPVYPVFRSLGNNVLRAVGSGNNLIADSYDPITKKITRRIGVKKFKVTDRDVYFNPAYPTSFLLTVYINNRLRDSGETIPFICSHFKWQAGGWSSLGNNRVSGQGGGAGNTGIGFRDDTITSSQDFRQFLNDQYDAGTPVTIYYPLTTPIEEDLVQ